MKKRRDPSGGTCCRKNDPEAKNKCLDKCCAEGLKAPHYGLKSLVTTLDPGGRSNGGLTGESGPSRWKTTLIDDGSTQKT